MAAARLVSLLDRGLPVGLGGKVGGLRWLAQRGFPIPRTWVLVHPSRNRTEIAAALGGLDPVRRYAVRSSANVEDGGAVSYAGQFASILDVSGLERLVEAVVEVVASTGAEGVVAYRQHQQDGRPIEMAVIVQEMVEPVFSGVAFSKNPITGLSETIVEAVAGSGDRLMDDGVTPDRWVYRWGDFLERPATTSLEPATVRSIVAAVADIAAAHGSPVDLEWVYDGARLWWVQVRRITGLEGVNIYSRRISKEVMPGIIKPLVWSVNVPMVNQAWVELFREAIGDVDLAPEDLARSFGYRSYFNMTAIGEVFAALGMPRESLELLLGLPPGSEQPRFKPTATTMTKLPRMLAMAIRKARYGSEVQRTLPGLEAQYRAFAQKDVQELSDEALLADIEDLRRIGVRSAGVNIVTPLLANAYTGLLKRRLDSHGVDVTEVDLTAGIADVDAFDPNPHMDRLAARLQRLEETEREEIRRNGYDAVPAELRGEVDRFLSQFGHFSDSGNDFSVPAWREMPDTVVKMTAARAPSTRAKSSVGWQEAEARIPARHRPVARLLRRQAATFIRHREAVSSLYTFGYGLFRPYFLEIGRRLTERSLLSVPDDVMYLTVEEVQAALRAEPINISLPTVIDERKREIAAVEHLEMPEVIYGDDFIPRPSDVAAASAWRGTPTARGHHRGPVRVVNGIADFERVQTGDVLAIPYSDAGWTPLFAKAGAVVAESGGMLSHSSIVAREYGIPCIVSVPGAMRIPEGAIVTVDGYRGVVTLADAE